MMMSFAVVFVVLACFLGAYLWNRRRASVSDVFLVEALTRTWEASDLERGDEAGAGGERLLANDKNPLVSAHMEMFEALRSLLREEILRGLERAGLSERLERLEKTVTAACPHATHAQSLDHGGAEVERSRPPPAQFDSAAVLELAPLEFEPVELSDDVARQLSTQQEFTRPSSEKDTLVSAVGLHCTDQEVSLETSFVALQQHLHKRDVETHELERQLRDWQQTSWQQSLEARYSNQRLRDLLCDPLLAPQTQAEELRSLRARVEDLLNTLAEAQSREVRWRITVKRQQTAMRQKERASKDAVDSLLRHPAGEIFLLPPPASDLGEDDCELPFEASLNVDTPTAKPHGTNLFVLEPAVVSPRSPLERNIFEHNIQNTEVEIHSVESVVQGKSMLHAGSTLQDRLRYIYGDEDSLEEITLQDTDPALPDTDSNRKRSTLQDRLKYIYEDDKETESEYDSDGDSSTTCGSDQERTSAWRTGLVPPAAPFVSKLAGLPPLPLQDLDQLCPPETDQTDRV